MREDEGDGHEGGDGELERGEGAQEEHARPVAVAEGPAHEVGVRAVLQGVGDESGDGGEGRRVRGVLQGVQDLRARAVGEVQLARRVGREVVAGDEGDLGAERLDGD